nr:MAG TPA: tail protein [Bacteriophage sp.]
MIQIYRNNQPFFALEDVCDGSKMSRQLMDHHYIVLKFSTEEPVYFEIGDSVEIADFGLFVLTSAYFPKYNETTDGYDYELQMDAYYMNWKNKICKYRPQYGANETSFKLTTSVSVHLNVVLSNLKALNYKYHNKDFSVDYTTYNKEVFDTEKRFLVEYSSISIIEALNTICETLDCEWWVDGSIIYLGYCEMNGQTTFEQGVNMLSMSQSESKSSFITRLYAFGSDKNIPSGYFSGADVDVTTDGIATDYLMLPNKDVDEEGYYSKDGYIENVNVVKNDSQAIEGVVKFEDEYPKVSCVVSAIKTYESTVDNEDGTKNTATIWQVTSNDSFATNFETSWIKKGLNLMIRFESGALTGMEFEVSFKIIDKVNYFEIVANDTYGRTLPDSVMCPKISDKFYLYNWDASKITETPLIPDAQEALYVRAKNYYKKSMVDNSNFTCVLDSEKFFNFGTYNFHPMGEQVKLINPLFSDTDKDGKHYRSSRIIGIEIKLDIPYDNPTYIVGEEAAYSRLGQLEDKVNSITVNGIQIGSENSNGGGVYIIGMNDTTPETDSNVYSARRTRNSFLSKVRADTAMGLINFAKGLVSKETASLHEGAQFGESFADGQAGFGGKIDGRGVGYLESLTLRSFMEAPEYRFNRISIRVGNDWRAAGGGIIENVEIEHDEEGNELQRGTVYLHLEKGEIGKIAVDDICQGIWHDHITLSNNSTDDYDDGIGNFRFGGFFTAYFRIVEVMSVNGGINNAFRYVLRSDKHWKALHHPASMMHFVAYGNFSDKTRQSSRYSTLTYERYLKDVNDWEFTENMIAAQFGDLSNLSIFGLNMTGYSAYLNNIYMSGTIQQFVKLGRKMHIDQSLGGYMAPGEVETVTVSVLDGYMQDHTEEYTFMVERNTGDTSADDVWNAMPEHINCGSTFEISFEDLHINPNHGGISTLFYVTADNGKEGERVSTAIEY